MSQDYSKKNNYYYFFETDTKEIIINIEFAAAGFDREPVPFNYGKQNFRIRKSNLYGKRKKPAFVTVLYGD